MLNTLKMALKIDLTYAINANIYQFKKLPILKNIIGDNAYKNDRVKKFARTFSILMSACRAIFFRLLYFFVIYYISSFINKNDITRTFIFIYFVFTFIGMFINPSILSTSTKKYFSIILFNMDAKKFMKASFIWTLFLSFILNSLGFLTLSSFLNYSVLEALCLILFSTTARIVGDAFSVYYYKKHGITFTTDYRHTLVVIGVFFAIGSLPFFNIFVPDMVIYWTLFIFLFASVICYIYLMRIKDYKLIYKKINTFKAAINSDAGDLYARQEMIRIKDKDKNIDSRKLKDKKGYDLFNTIFFERHKEILMRSAKNFSLIILIIIIVLGVLSFYNNDIYNNIHDFLLNRLGWFVLIMYLINRGSVVTQAMFYNCDHAMLRYNFYREPDVILGLFKKRLTMLIKINLLPAIVIAIGSIVLLSITTDGSLVINYIMVPLFIIVLSVFFSVHYLVIYYLLQPYNKDLQVRSISYTFVSFITLVLTYILSNLVMSSLYFSILGIVLTGAYIIVSLKLVYKYAPSTFRIHS